INRLLAVGMLLKRAGQGRLDLMGGVMGLLGAVMQGDFGAAPEPGPLSGERDRTERVRKIALLSLGLAFQRFGSELEKEQETVSALADLVMTLYAMDSAVRRAADLVAAGRDEPAASIAAVIAHDGLAAAVRSAETVLAATVQGAKLD